MKTLLTVAALLIGLQLQAQTTSLRLYIDCELPACNLDFIRRELPVMDFVRDRQECDVHVLVSTQSAGNGGEKYTVQLIGQHTFSNLTDTFALFVQPAQTAGEIRVQLIKRLKTGLVPFMAKAGQASLIKIEFDAPDTAKNTAVTDPWNYWVISVGGDAYFNGDKNYKQASFSGNFSASRTTEASKIHFNLYSSNSRNTYSFDDSNGNGKSVLKTTNDYIYASHSWIKSLNERWSAGYETEFEKSTYDNLDAGITAATGIEYNIYPYKLSSTKFLVVRYELGAEKRKYMQETIFGKTNETLFYHELGMYASFTQPWGRISSFVAWYNYFHDVSKNNLSFHANAELRLFKGLSLNFYGDASIINDQLHLSKDGATTEEVLLRLKSLSTSFNYYTGVGLSYRFGSKFNNFVNPRFTNGR